MDIDDDTYDLLLRLEAEGVIRSGLLATRPLSRREAERLILEAEKNSEGMDPFIRQMVKNLRGRLEDGFEGVKYIKPVDRTYAGYIHSDQDGQELNYNNDGDIYEDGSNLRLGLASRAELDWISFYMNPELRYSEDDEDLVMKRVYGVLAFRGLELQAGMDSQWWGPGYHGSLLLSNNAQPLTMLKLTNPHPALLPWVFRRLGPFRFVVFAARLEEERTVPEPYIWGMRLNFKPSPYVEFGLQRTALLGGEGRPEDIETWWSSFTTSGENDPENDAGDQRAGVDLKLTMPFRAQPLQLYAEVDGEDNALDVPSERAWLAGLYLPRILGIQRVSLRAEYATTHVSDKPDVWYSHHIYQSGYTYKGRIIGHHMGADSDDVYIELCYSLPELNGWIKLLYDRERHSLSEDPELSEYEASVRVKAMLSEDLALEGRYSYGESESLTDSEVTGENESIIMISLTGYF
jgi:hypothetical protein